MIKQPKIITNYLWNGWQAMNPIGTIIHNDYGFMDAEQYEEWLKGRVDTPEKGFAHDYIDRNGIGHFVPTNRAAYHAGDGHGIGNGRYIGIEVNQSRGSEKKFIENENMALRQSAEYHHRYGWKPNRTTVKLHNQFANTSCPHRSQAIHGNGVKVQDYFITKVKEYMALGKTVKEMINAENGGKPVKPSSAKPKPVAPKPVTGKQTLHLPASAKTWRVYKPNGPYTVGNEIHLLTPSAYGGIDYEIKGNPATDIYLIDTGVKGRVAIYAHPSTGAKITGSKATVAKPTPPKQMAKSGIERKYKESGTFYPNNTIIVGDQPSTDGKIIARYYKGEHVKYHTVHLGNRYVWLEYNRSNGGRGFIPCRTYSNGKYGTLWGTIK